MGKLAANDLDSAVSRSIVDHQRFERFVLLQHDGFETGKQIVFSIPGGNYDPNLKMIVHLQIPQVFKVLFDLGFFLCGKAKATGSFVTVIVVEENFQDLFFE